MDKIKFSCPKCGTQLSVGHRAAGRNAKCPDCENIMTIPNQSTVPEATPLIFSQPKASTRQTKKCPFCSEEILLEAVKCKHCGEFLDASSRPTEPKPIKKRQVSTGSGCLILLVIVIALFYFLSSGGGGGDSDTSSKSRTSIDSARSTTESVYQTCYDFAYKGGYEQGKSDRINGYPYSPEVALAEPPVQMIIMALKEKVGHSDAEVDRGFRNGYFAGYKDGYY